MLVAGVLFARADRALPPLGELGNALRGWLYELVGSHDAAMAELLHQWPRPGPATVALLPGGAARELTLRVTAVDAALAQVLLAALTHTVERGGEVRLGEVALELRGGALSARDHPWAGLAEPHDLLDEPPATGWRLEFATPTVHKTGDVWQPLPVPRSLWGSWLRRWNDFMPPERVMATDLLDAFDQHVQLTELRLRSACVRGKGGAVPGYLGTVGVAARGLDPALAAAMSRLAAFSFWAGTGANTLTGMGATRWWRDG